MYFYNECLGMHIIYVAMCKMHVFMNINPQLTTCEHLNFDPICWHAIHISH